VEAAGFVVDDQKLAVGLFGEPHDARGGPGGFDAVPERRALNGIGEDAARLPVAVDVPAFEALQLRAVIDVAARDGGRNGVGKDVGRRHDGRRAALAVRQAGLEPFHDAPAVVAALLRGDDHFPPLPAHVADPELPGFPVEAHPPRIAETVAPDLGPRLRVAHEGIVRGDRVRAAVGGAVDVDAQDGRQEIGDVLAGLELVGRRGVLAVAGRDIREAVIPEVEVAAVMCRRRAT
jgi:hypothetical protein